MERDLLLETEVIRHFVTKDRQERYLNLISSTGHRKKFIGELANFKHLKFSEFDKLTVDIQTVIKNRIE